MTNESDAALRRKAIEQAKANNALSGFEPSAFGLSIFDQWIVGHWTADEAVSLVIQHHQELEKSAAASDNAASPNKLGITDSARLKQAEADITTLRMAELGCGY